MAQHISDTGIIADSSPDADPPRRGFFHRFRRPRARVEATTEKEAPDKHTYKTGDETETTVSDSHSHSHGDGDGDGEWGPIHNNQHQLTYSDEIDERLSLLFPMESASEREQSHQELPLPKSPDRIKDDRDNDEELQAERQTRGQWLTARIIDDLSSSSSSESSFSSYDPCDFLGATDENKNENQHETSYENDTETSYENHQHEPKEQPKEPRNPLQSCLTLLSSNDHDCNRLGLQRLNLLTSGRRVFLDAPFALVIGGPLGSTEELLRFVFVTMICDNPHTHRDRSGWVLQDEDEEALEESLELEDRILGRDPSNDSGINSDSDSNDASGDHDVDDESVDGNSSNNDDYSIHSNGSCDSKSESESESKYRSQGKSGGALHNHALKILANALGAVYAADPGALEEIPLHCSLWKSIIMSLVENIEHNHSANANITLYSMKVLRFLCFVQPNMILPLLRYSLFSVLVDLKDYGKTHELPMIAEEASKLLLHARSKQAT